MEALYAGLAAWGIELAVAGLAFYLLYREEQKVYKSRAAKKEEIHTEENRWERTPRVQRSFEND